MPCQVSVQSVVANSWPLAQGSGAVRPVWAHAGNAPIASRESIMSPANKRKRLRTGASYPEQSIVDSREGSVYHIRFYCRLIYRFGSSGAVCENDVYQGVASAMPPKYSNLHGVSRWTLDGRGAAAKASLLQGR